VAPDDVAERYAAEAEAVTRRAARTFHLASRLLPRAVRRDVLLLYLVLRTLDDAVDDGAPDAAAQLGAVERWLDGGAPETREAAVLADLDARHGLPEAALRAFLQGMRDDLHPPHIVTEADLDLYCYRVAGAVGELMTAILGVTRDDAWGAARALGLVMQRTNVLRDVDEDLANGRVYLAAETLARFGVDDLRTADRSALYRDQIARADALYDPGLAGVDALVHGGRAIAAAGRMYREILRQIEREGLGASRTRAVVPRRRKLVLVAGALARPSG
jgi:phytoene synthase